MNNYWLEFPVFVSRDYPLSFPSMVILGFIFIESEHADVRWDSTKYALGECDHLWIYPVLIMPLPNIPKDFFSWDLYDLLMPYKLLSHCGRNVSVSIESKLTIMANLNGVHQLPICGCFGKHHWCCPCSNDVKT